MLIKQALIPEVDEYGITRVVPFGVHGTGLEKAASLPDGVQRFAEKFHAEKGEVALLVTAMGALEAFGVNSNGDAFTERCLNHVPADWADEPERDRVTAAGWGWGYPTFYRAKIFAHHLNKNPEKSIGEIGYVTWDPKMKCVQAVVVIKPEQAKKFGGQWVLDRVGQNRAIPWSMGCRVPYDLMSTSKDWELYEKAWASYDPAKHKSPADAILHYHDHVHKIHGLSRTRREYPDELLYHMNEVLWDGKKIYVYNDFPSFFDLSAVGVPADQVAWSILKIGSHCTLAGTKCAGACSGGACSKRYVIPGAVLEENFDMLLEKAAGLHVASLGKGAVVKKCGDIDKEVPALPQVAESSKRLDSEGEPGLPKELLDLMGERKGLRQSLSTPTCMGMLLKPREFRRVMLVHMGKKPLADKLDSSGEDLPVSFEEHDPGTMGPEAFDDDLGKLLEPFLGSRSWLGPVAVKRVKITIMRMSPKDGAKEESEPETQKKVAALYNGYRKQAERLVERSREVMGRRPGLRASVYGFGGLAKMGGAQISGMMTPLVTQDTRAYFRNAYR